jgi:hypothetical protein
MASGEIVHHAERRPPNWHCHELLGEMRCDDACVLSSTDTPEIKLHACRTRGSSSSSSIDRYRSRWRLLIAIPSQAPIYTEQYKACRD